MTENETNLAKAIDDFVAHVEMEDSLDPNNEVLADLVAGVIPVVDSAVAKLGNVAQDGDQQITKALSDDEINVLAAFYLHDDWNLDLAIGLFGDEEASDVVSVAGIAAAFRNS